MKVNRSDIEKNLPKKGFLKEVSGHHIFFYHQMNGKETGAYTKISHSRKMKDISDDILSCMKKQLRLNSTGDVVGLIKCPIDGRQYIQILKKKKII